MHRTTPNSSAHRAYSAGDSRAMIDTIDDAKHMQEGNNCQGMRGESWGRMEAPQNYGFTSVVADAVKDANGMIKDCAEGFVSFMGGNRSFPVMGVMDDRRHRLLNLAKDAAKGSTAMFGLREWGQQLLNTADGFYMTGNLKKKLRFALVENSNDQQQQQGQQQQANGGAGGGTSGSGSGTQAAQKGQKTLHKQKTDIAIEQNKDSTTSQHGQFYSAQCKGSDSSCYYDDKKTSTQVTDSHAHLRTGGNRIFTDKSGCWSTVPILTKKDGYCKT